MAAQALFYFYSFINFSMTATEIESGCVVLRTTLGTGTNEEIMKGVSLGRKTKKKTRVNEFVLISP